MCYKKLFVFPWFVKRTKKFLFIQYKWKIDCPAAAGHCAAAKIPSVFSVKKEKESTKFSHRAKLYEYDTYIDFYGQSSLLRVQRRIIRRGLVYFITRRPLGLRPPERNTCKTQENERKKTLFHTFRRKETSRVSVKSFIHKSR